MSVVVVVPDWTTGTRTGGHFVEQMLIGALAKLTDVHLLAVTDSPGTAAPRHRATTVTACARRPIGTAEKLLGPLPTVALWSRGVGAEELVRQLVCLHRASHVFISASYSAVNVPRDIGVPLVVVALNVEHRRIRGVGSVRASVLRRTWLRLQGTRAARLERDVLRRAATVLAVSHQDRDLIQTLVQPTARVIMMPVVPEDGLFSLVDVDRPRANVLFMGSLGYPPNVEAARQVAEDVLPRIRAVRPDAKLLIAGSTPPPSFRRVVNGREDIAMMADFARTEDVFRQATVFVAPLPHQEGISIKSLSAFASGTPVVTSRAVLRSLGAEANVHALAAENPEATAGAVLSLLEDSAMRARIAGAARAFVLENFSEGRLQSALESALSVT